MGKIMRNLDIEKINLELRGKALEQIILGDVAVVAVATRIALLQGLILLIHIKTHFF